MYLIKIIKVMLILMNFNYGLQLLVPKMEINLIKDQINNKKDRVKVYKIHQKIKMIKKMCNIIIIYNIHNKVDNELIIDNLLNTNNNHINNKILSIYSKVR
jgi:hypothetical protein